MEDSQPQQENVLQQQQQQQMFPELPADLSYDDQAVFEWVVDLEQAKKDCQQNPQKKLLSPYFSCGNAIFRTDADAVGTKAELQWRLLLFPFGNQNDNQLSIFLECSSFEKLDKRWHQCAIFNLLAVNPQDESKLFSQQARHRYVTEEADWGFARFCSPQDLMHKGILSSDGKFTLRVYLRTVIDESGTLWHNFANWDSKRETGFVGFKNQGATCYMNSLLQSLYFTNGFRRAVYKIPTDKDDTGKSVPLALQRVFYSLQASDDAVDTRELTKSFGWDTLDAFMQHDVQEFNRVLQDNLETKMKGTESEGAIEKLFVGKMKSYIKCINVDFESSREEAFYDIQLNVKGMPSLADSFKDYIQTELLDGDNKYQSEKYGLQDARKGVIFLKFPPVLHLQLKRFEYDFMKDAMVKINDRYEYPESIDLSSYLEDGGKSAGKQVYKLHGVLVHSGDVHGGHYMAFLKPGMENKWYKFDDDRVVPVSEKEVYEDNYGGDPLRQVRTTTNGDGNNNISQELVPTTAPVPVRTKAQLLKRFTNAYMLVYIRESDLDEMLKPIQEDEVPMHLKLAVEKEEQDRKRIEQEMAERHLFVYIRTLTVDDMKSYEGFDLVPVADSSVGTLHKVKKDMTWLQFKQQLAQQLTVQPEQVRLWSFMQRQNQTTRLDLPLEGSIYDDLQIEEVLRKVHHRSTEMRVFLDVSQQKVQDGGTGKVVYHPIVSKDTAVLFIKYYDPARPHLQLLGTVRAKMSMKAVDLVPQMLELWQRQYPSAKPLSGGSTPAVKMYEEIKPGMVELLKSKNTLQQSELMTGDIIAFQFDQSHSSAKDQDKNALYEYPTVLSYYDYLLNRLTIPFKLKPLATNNVDQSQQQQQSMFQQEFELVLSKKNSYDQMASKVAQEVGITDPQKIRFWYHPTGGEFPKLMVKRVPTMTVSEIINSNFYSASVHPLFWYEPLDMSISELESMSNWSLTLLDQNMREKEVVKVLAHKDGKVHDLINSLKQKRPNVNVHRIYEVLNSRKITELMPDVSLTTLGDYNTQICVDTEPFYKKELLQKLDQSKNVLCFHFAKDFNRGCWGVPFYLNLGKVSDDLPEVKTVKDLRLRIKSRLGLSDKEVNKIKLYAIPSSGAGDGRALESTTDGESDEQSVVSFQPGELLGLEHPDKTVKRGGMERSIKIHN
ncbi:hypothetical protein MP228_003334 [Amoeboaphelidium protococcarum]|nr:hypothetical protein MP228_003334 [Amoeboaphelidium protococcarum]